LEDLKQTKPVYPKDVLKGSFKEIQEQLSKQ